MLTVAKLAVIIKYDWNFRHFEAVASTAEKDLMDVDWDDLGEILADLRLLNQQLLSTGYARKIHAELLAACADEATAQTFIGYASTL
ncbi:MAG: hypothetical protein M3Y54_09075 [Bacteroidota bacterium]|nr:hypothetical protein [Bacteroidota bacterium]